MASKCVTHTPTQPAAASSTDPVLASQPLPWQDSALALYALPQDRANRGELYFLPDITGYFDDQTHFQQIKYATHAAVTH